MHIWIDGDACPKVIKNILFSAAKRTKTHLVIVSNHFIEIPPSPFIQRQIVSAGFDIADNYIVENTQPNDLVITADIPLADAIIAKRGIALNPRGKLYTQENIKQILAARNFNETLRDTGVITGGPGKISPKEVQAFSNHIDRLLNKRP